VAGVATIIRNDLSELDGSTGVSNLSAFAAQPGPGRTLIPSQIERDVHTAQGVRLVIAD
jgi:hypothetical protein